MKKNTKNFGITIYNILMINTAKQAMLNAR